MCIVADKAKKKNNTGVNIKCPFLKNLSALRYFTAVLERLFASPASA